MGQHELENVSGVTETFQSQWPIPPSPPIMDFLQMKHLKRKRKSNYSVKETQTLIREIHKRREILFSRQQNMAINELKRRAWEEVADSVNALGEGELRTAAEVKRRYLDWRALMKRKQLQAELASGLKQEFESSSPDNEASLGGGDQSLDLSGFSKDSSCDWQDLTDLGEPSTHTPGVKMEDDEASSYRVCTCFFKFVPQLLADFPLLWFK